MRNLCPVCSDAQYATCEGCLNIFNTDALHHTESGTYCERCIERNRYRGAIREYDYTPDFKFHCDVGETTTRETPFIGIELEIEADCDADDGADHRLTLLKDAAAVKAAHPAMYCVHDGSINNGFEIVTHPMTFRYFDAHRKEFSALLAEMARKGYTSYQSGRCGIHIHVSKAAFGNWHLYKLMHFVYTQPEFIRAISQRTTESIRRWASLHGEQSELHMLPSIAKSKYAFEKYYAINLLHDNTIEFRMFRGTLNRDSFFKNVEFIHALWSFTRNNTLSSMTAAQFAKFVSSNRKQYKHLHEFISRKELL